MTVKTRRGELETAYLRHIELFCVSGDPNAHLLRTLVCGWFAYHTGGPWLNSRGRPRWLNRPHPTKDRAILEACQIHSAAAKVAISQRAVDQRLKIEHAIPFAVLRDHIHRMKPFDVEKFLVENYRVAAITAEEDGRLTKKGLRSRMPEHSELNPTARYTAAGIEIALPTV